jgi:hypothetical protein
MKTTWLCVGAVLLLAAPSRADVITVDDDGGADFGDMPQAVAAAAPGDTLLVHPGQYSSFTIDAKPLTVLGLASGQVIVAGTSRVTGVTAPSRVVLCQVDFERLALSGNSGAVILDEVRVFGPEVAFFSVAQCADVRAIALVVDSVHAAQDGSPKCAARITEGTRFEATESWIVGNSGTYLDDQYGWAGIRGYDDCRLYLAATSVFGGKGSDETGGWCFDPGYEGGSGIVLESAARVRVAGLPSDLIQGGKTGNPTCGQFGQTCPIRLVGVGSQAVWSGVTLDPTWTSIGQYCGGVQGQSAATPDPWLEREHTPLAGGQARFYAHGEPGDVVTLFVGRNAVVVPLAGVEVEQLTSQERSFELGTIDASGVVSFAMTVPPSLPPGFCFFGQARILRQGSELRTNSVPIVLR